MTNFIPEFTLLDLNPRLEYWTIYADGSPTTGLGGVVVIVLTPEKDVLEYGVQLRFLATNNEAEYEAILTSLRVAKALGAKNLKLKTDSKLIVGQTTNKYEAKKETMKR